MNGKNDSMRISIIVPIYNSELYLKRCIDSLVNQTYNNIEIILVNDGSLDESEIICEEYSLKYDNIKYYSKRNGGLGSARNFGLEKCTGDYVGFIDSDDWVDKDYFECLIHMLYKERAQVASFSLDITSKYNESNTIKNIEPDIVLNGGEILEYYFKGSIKDSNLFSVCTSLFSRDVIGEVRFREGKINEDMDFKFKVLQQSNVWVISKEKKYHYYQAGSSLSSGKIKKKDMDIFEASQLLLELAIGTKSETNRQYAEIGTIKPYFSIVLRMAVYGADEDVDTISLRKKAIHKLRSHYTELMLSPIKLSRKFLISLFCISYTGTQCVLRLLKNFI